MARGNAPTNPICLSACALIAITSLCPTSTVSAQPPTASASTEVNKDGANNQLSAAIYRARRQRLLDRLGGCMAVLPSRRAGHKGVDRSFFYLTGSSDPHTTLLLSPRQVDRHILLVTPPPDAVDRYDLHVRSAMKQNLAMDSVVLVEPKKMYAHERSPIARALRHSRCYAVLRPDIDRHPTIPKAVLDAHLTAYGARVEQRWQALESMRSIKDDHELVRMNNASAIASHGAREAAIALKANLTEREASSRVSTAVRELADGRLSYPALVVTGPATARAKLVSGTRPMRSSELAIVDVGASFAGYHSRIVRTFPVGEQFSPREQQLLDLVVDAQTKAIAAMRSGISLARVQQIAERAIAQTVFPADQKTSLAPFVHTHFIGLESDDVGDPDAPLDAGMVVVIEVGLSVRGMQGIRVADSVLITSRAHRILTTSVPKRAPELVEWLKKHRKPGS